MTKFMTAVLFIIAMMIPSLSFADDAKLWSVDDLTALKKIKPGNNRNLNRFDGDLCVVEDYNGSGVMALYRFDKFSSAAGDDDTIVTPLQGNGRWELVSVSDGTVTYDSTSGKRMLIARNTYSFAAHGGAVSSIPLTGDALPETAVPTVCYYWVDTALDSATDAAEIALKYKYNGTTYNTFKTAAVISTAGTAGIKVTNFTGPSDSQTRNKVASGTGSGTFELVVSVEALTAGKFTLICEYLIGQ